MDGSHGSLEEAQRFSNRLRIVDGQVPFGRDVGACLHHVANRLERSEAKYVNLDAIRIDLHAAYSEMKNVTGSPHSRAARAA